jgi:hypothetical protein
MVMNRRIPIPKMTTPVTNDTAPSACYPIAPATTRPEVGDAKSERGPDIGQ